ncbi:Zn-dependent exopeptidase [Hygrophoropsis aurantiaca]|uniref:Zn-dependent exopeptidase n=1 Tax=Hygrophoropsis aurantiaca TaxID=72124 RepID=A0ACB7ZZY7_9AGAM|nr:Zn-dependent exopeptidase [Hygrophoropsis aurantiaca]
MSDQPPASGTKLNPHHVYHVYHDDEHDAQHLERLLAEHPDPVDVMRLLDPTALDEPRLLQVFGREAVWMTEGDKLRLRRQGLKFMDLTDYQRDLHPDTTALTSKLATPQAAQTQWPELRYHDRVRDVITQLSVEYMREKLSVFSAFYNRYFVSPHGVRSSRWLYDQLLQIIAAAPPTVRLSLETFTHSFPQPSLIARFEPTHGRVSPNAHIAQPPIIIGAHLDSANYDLPLLPAPGADDDGSGAIALLDVFRVLVEAGFTPERAVELHWYAAEEAGLLGSLQVAEEYRRQGRRVGAMFQLDALGYVGPNGTPTLTFITSDVDAALTNWTIALAAEYASPTVQIQSVALPPGEGSDHMPWGRLGVPVAAATEEHPHRANPYHHTADDRMDVEGFSFEFIREFAKVAVGFAVELGGWAE